MYEIELDISIRIAVIDIRYSLDQIYIYIYYKKVAFLFNQMLPRN